MSEVEEPDQDIDFAGDVFDSLPEDTRLEIDDSGSSWGVYKEGGVTHRVLLPLPTNRSVAAFDEKAEIVEPIDHEVKLHYYDRLLQLHAGVINNEAVRNFTEIDDDNKNKDSLRINLENIIDDNNEVLGVTTNLLKEKAEEFASMSPSDREEYFKTYSENF